MKQRASLWYSAIVVGSLMAGAGLWGCGADNGTGANPGLPNGPATRAQVVQGRQLVVQSGCSDCHNRGPVDPSDPNWLAGYIQSATLNPSDAGHYLIGPYNVYAPNLTPDKATGLGTWTAQDIFNALRNGKDTSGHFLCPPMPWPSIRNMSDGDIYAIAAYLKSLKPVSNAVPESEGPGVAPGSGLRGDWSSSYAGLTPVPPYPAGNEILVP